MVEITSRDDFVEKIGKSQYSKDTPNILQSVANTLSTHGGCRCSIQNRQNTAQNSYLNLANLTDSEKLFIKSYLNTTENIVIKNGNDIIIEF